MKVRILMFGVLVLLLAVPAVAAAEGGQDCPWGYPAYDVATGTLVAQCSNGKIEAGAKPAGLARPASVTEATDGWPGCPWRDAYDPMANGYAPGCFIRPAGVDAATKPTGLAKPAPIAPADQPRCRWGFYYAPADDGYAPVCFDGPASVIEHPALGSAGK